MEEKTDEKGYDFINPNHYKKGSKEVWEMMLLIWGEEMFIAHCEMNAFKYRMRLGEKPNQPVERDLEKAKWYEEKAKEIRNKIAERQKLSESLGLKSFPLNNCEPFASDSNVIGSLIVDCSAEDGSQIDDRIKGLMTHEESAFYKFLVTNHSKKPLEISIYKYIENPDKNPPFINSGEHEKAFINAVKLSEYHLVHVATDERGEKAVISLRKNI